MKITKKTVPYSSQKCTWDGDSEGWLFNWGEEIPNDWVEFSIKHQFPVESINRAYEMDSTYFELNENTLTEILEGL